MERIYQPVELQRRVPNSSAEGKHSRDYTAMRCWGDCGILTEQLPCNDTGLIYRMCNAKTQNAGVCNK